MATLNTTEIVFKEIATALKEGLDEFISIVKEQPGTETTVEELSASLPLIEQFKKWSKTMPERKLRDAVISVITALDKTIHEAVLDEELKPEAYGASEEFPSPPFIADIVIQLGPELNLSNDHMTAHALIDETFIHLWNLENLEEGLQNRGIQVELIQDNMKKMLDNPGAPYQVAVGEPPVPGVDGNLEDLLGLEENSKLLPAITEKDRADFKELDAIRNIRQGQVIMKRTSPLPGTPGQNVLGQPVLCKDGDDIPFPDIPNTEISESGQEMISTVDGCAYLDGERIILVPALLIQGHVDYSTGNISASVTVNVNGDVLSGFMVESEMDVIVKGTVEGGRIIAKGNVILPGGVQGKGEADIQAGNNVDAKFINAAKVRAKGEINVHGSIIQSNLQAKRIQAKDQNAEIIGGTINAADDVCADLIGSDMGVKTEVRLGYDIKELEVKIERLNESITKYKEQYEKYTQSCESLQSSKKKKGALSPAQKTMQEKLTENLKKVKQALRAKEALLEQTGEALIKAQNLVRTVRAKKKIFPGVKITILEETFVSKEITGPVSIQLGVGELMVKPFEERTFEDEEEVDE